MLAFLTSLAILCTTISTLPQALHAQTIVLTPRMEISSQEALLDEDIQIRFSHLKPHDKVVIRAQTIDDNGVQWSSYGLFEANEDGCIDLSKQPPIEGSYQGIDPMGLLWSMQPPASDRHASFKIKNDRYCVTLTAYRGTEEICSRDIVRLRKALDVKKIIIREEGLNAILFMPASESALPLIITLSGSSGGYGENRAQLLASHGFAVLALAYFGVEGLPSHLQDIPLEYFETAFSWIKKRPELDSSHVGLYGISRGAELALILGSRFPQSVQAIAAVVPSSVVNGGLSETPVHAWVYHGEPISMFAPVPRLDFSGELGKDYNHLAKTSECFLEAMKDEKGFEEAAIPVEKITASLLLVSGGDDHMWPSSLFAAQIQKRLENAHSSLLCTYLHYPKAGHGINIPHLPQPGPVYYHPVGKLWFSMGGTAAEDQYASQDSWKKLIDFFHSSLKGKNL